MVEMTRISGTDIREAIDAGIANLANSSGARFTDLMREAFNHHADLQPDIDYYPHIIPAFFFAAAVSFEEAVVADGYAAMFADMSLFFVETELRSLPGAEAAFLAVEEHAKKAEDAKKC